MKTQPKAVLLVLLSTVFASSGQIFIKMGANNLSFDVVSFLLNYPLYVGYAFYLLGAALLIVSLKWGDLSVLYPIYALNFIWVSILSPMFFEADSMNPVKWLGVFLVVLGVSVVGYGSRGGDCG
ncbi:MAG: hypothetical protein GF334_07860 [Candidatus Altiarchaeales archaeon]|nr:hypothetical protein [Candidatus Altiarchaeales archaeon]